MSEMPNFPSLAAYLIKNGWSEKAGKKRLVFETGQRYQSETEVSYRIFEHPRDKEVDLARIVLPIGSDGNTPARFISDAIRYLASFYDMNVGQVTAAIE